jgi:hypothetical protein
MPCEMAIETQIWKADLDLVPVHELLALYFSAFVAHCPFVLMQL